MLVKSAWLPPTAWAPPVPPRQARTPEGLRPSRHSLGPADLGAGDGTDEGHHPAVGRAAPADGRLPASPCRPRPGCGPPDAERQAGAGAGSEPPARPQLPGATPTTHAAQAAEQRARPRPWGRSQRNRKSRAYWVPVALVWSVGVPVWGVGFPCGGGGSCVGVWGSRVGWGLWLSCGLWGPHPRKETQIAPEH